jgi:hypothetical protein
MSDSKSMSFSVSLPGTFWSGGWLFAIGYLHLSFWQGVLAIILWPYDIGVHFR